MLIFTLIYSAAAIACETPRRVTVVTAMIGSQLAKLIRRKMLQSDSLHWKRVPLRQQCDLKRNYPQLKLFFSDQ